MEFSGENKWQWLRPYIAIARFVGWMLIFFGMMDVIGSSVFWARAHMVDTMSLYDLIGIRIGFLLSSLSGVLRNELVPGILALGVAQFLSCLVEQETRPGWLLRQGPHLLILAALVYLIQLVQMIWRIPEVIRNAPSENMGFLEYGMPAIIITQGLIARLAPVIILFGLAEALRRMGPIVDESKSTV